jgi:esterase/lipase superfamily enzyme
LKQLSTGRDASDDRTASWSAGRAARAKFAAAKTPPTPHRLRGVGALAQPNKKSLASRFAALASMITSTMGPSADVNYHPVGAGMPTPVSLTEMRASLSTSRQETLTLRPS